MNEVKTPKKPLVFYYGIAMVVLLLLNMLVMPLMIVSMLVGVTSMFGDVHAQLGWYCIPLYNSVQCMSGVLAFSASAAAVGVTVAVNLALAACMTLILRRLFNSESVMFSR